MEFGKARQLGSHESGWFGLGPRLLEHISLFEEKISIERI